MVKLKVRLVDGFKQHAGLQRRCRVAVLNVERKLFNNTIRQLA